MSTNNHIDYVEFKAADLPVIKSFYSAAFGWDFTDYGPSYTAFSSSGLFGGFEESTEPVVNGALVVLYHEQLEACEQRVIEAGGAVVQPIFSFPGGRRFHFKDPAGNVLAVWSDK